MGRKSVRRPEGVILRKRSKRLIIIIIIPAQIEAIQEDKLMIFIFFFGSCGPTLRNHRPALSCCRSVQLKNAASSICLSGKMFSTSVVLRRVRSCIRNGMPSTLTHGGEGIGYCQANGGEKNNIPDFADS